MKREFSLSVVMPVHNEQSVINKVVHDYCKILDTFTQPEFIIIDDHSTDATPQILHEIKKDYPYIRLFTNTNNMGHGPSLVRGYKESSGEYVFHCDRDNQFLAEDFWLLWEKMQKDNLDAAIGCRRQRNDPGHRILISKLLKLFL